MEKLPAGQPKNQDIWGTFKNNWFSQIFAGFANIGQVLGDIAGAFLGGGSFGPGPLKDISDKAMEDAAKIVDLQDRAQVLEGIIGYGSYVASQNLFVSIDQDLAGARTLAFDREVGHTVGVTMVPDPALAGKIVQRMDSKGLWQVLAQTRARNTIYTGSAKVYMDIVVKAPDGSEYYRRSMDAVAISSNGGDGEVTLMGNVFFTIPAAGYTVHVDLFTGRWRYFYGGSQWSGLSVLKHSSEVQNTGTVDPGAPPVAG